MEQNMKALVCSEYGPIENLEVKDIPVPEVKDGQVRIRIAYASVNFPDTLIVQGRYQLKPQVPFVVGHECSGIVEEVGANVPNCQVGDRVLVNAGTDSIAEQIVIRHQVVRQVPATVSLNVAATLGITYVTSFHGLRDKGNLQAGETVLVLGAAGGVGSAAIEIAKGLGATVIAAASTQEKLDYCKSIGADEVINYDTEDLKQRVMELTGGKGANIVYDPVGGNYSEQAFRSLGYGGRHLVVGFADNAIPAIPLNLALLSERSIIGVYTGAWTKFSPKEMTLTLQLLGSMLKVGKLKPLITKQFSLDDSKAAIKYAASRQVMGKIVIEVNSTLE